MGKSQLVQCSGRYHTGSTGDPLYEHYANGAGSELMRGSVEGFDKDGINSQCVLSWGFSPYSQTQGSA